MQTYILNVDGIEIFILLFMERGELKLRYLSWFEKTGICQGKLDCPLEWRI